MKKPPKKPFTDTTRFEIWINAKKHEGYVIDSYYHDSEMNNSHAIRKLGWRLLICYDVENGEKKTVERHFHDLRKLRNN